MMARGELQVIGATTLDEYRKHIEKDAALERRFQPIQVDQPTTAQTIEILKGLRDRYESFHRVTITDDALEAAATLADRYINDRFLPDKAIDLIDEAGARLAIRKMTAPPELRELDEKIAVVRRDKEASIDGQDFEKAAALRDEEQRLGAMRAEREQAWKDGDMDVVSVVDEDLITEVLSMATGIPVFKLTEAESAKLLRMEEELHKRVIGQDEAVVALSQAIRRTRAGPAARSSSPGPPASARRSWPRPWRSSSSATSRRSSPWTCPSTRRSTRSRASSARLPDTSATTRAAS